MRRAAIAGLGSGWASCVLGLLILGCDAAEAPVRPPDVVLIVGANDVVNPMARDADPSIPIAGMPILNVDEARSVVVIKRSLGPGFAGIAKSPRSPGAKRAR